MSKVQTRNCNEYDAELILNIYPLLEKRCKDIDKSISNMSGAYSNGVYRTQSVFDLILDKIEEKNQTINIKLAIEDILTKLKPKTLKMALLMLNYPRMEIKDLIFVLDVPERSVYRRKETLLFTLADVINKSKHKERIVNYIDSHSWTLSHLESIKCKRLKFNNKEMEEE